MRLASRFTDKRALAITLCWVAALALTGATEALLFLAPALLIIVPLLGGRYLGEDLIIKLATRQGRPPRRPGTAVAWSLPPVPDDWQPRGARLIALSLAKRPPPLRLLPQT